MLKNPPTDQFASVESVGVAIRHVPGGHHLALLYNYKDSPRLLHLTMDHGVKDVEPDDVFCWLQCGLDKYNKLIVSALCRDIALRSQTEAQVPYRFWFNGDYFDTFGGNIADPGAGLTCSTFVLAVFRALKIELVKVEEWPPAQGTDQDAQMLITVSTTQQPFLMSALQDQWGVPRFSPAQVAAATSAANHPVSYIAASRAGQRVETKLKQLRPGLAPL